VTLEQLRYAFKDDPKWKDLKVDDSQLCQIIQSEEFEDEKNKGEINIYSLILWGLILCAGDARLKARVFYDVLQDSLQENISANDKDFKGTFSKLIKLATKVVYQFEHESSNQEKISDEKITDDFCETMADEVLDAIFDQLSKLPRKDYMEAVASKQSWIFSSKQIRDKVDKAK
jgi:hypothetical protein